MTVLSPPLFTLRIPESWFEFDVWRATRTGDLSRLVDRRLTELPELRPHRCAILRGLRDLAAEAERAGAVYCAAAADDVGGDRALLASLMVFTTAGMPEPGLNTVEAIAAQIPAVSRSETTLEWREVRLLEFGAGRAVRVRGVTVLPPSVPLVSMQTLVPVPDSEAVLNVVLTSPQAALAEPLLGLFDEISSTLAWRPGLSPH
ncbi:hypothetical protein [uncultured Pseudokineococcus sp.]|uniref:hypothetical protein n=1 Tax=uncultured Pseudokineococcus sp. TaxID=1642928 RepID=UPI002610EB9D|nr:hypothetical protein [uncultured Pseudokineococcus sp.]